MELTLTIVDEDGITWDLKAVDNEGASIEFFGIDISEMPLDGFAIELMIEGDGPTAYLAETPDDLLGDYSAE